MPGYNVRVPQLPDAERDRNLEMLQFISEETAARGMEFQLGLWMHGYEWNNSPNAELHDRRAHRARRTARTAATPCARCCKAVPAISGVTFRVHGESGVAEGSYDFWKTVFEGVAHMRPQGRDRHAREGHGPDHDRHGARHRAAVKISPKYWAEHLGMPYHQADIREQERPRPGAQATGLMTLSAGSRSFTRYGYGDLLREDRQWGVLHRIWPGTQRLLIWGDPRTAAAYSRAFSFCGSDGVEIMEPLSFKGRRGPACAGDRSAYADESLKPRWDWEKYVYSFRVWGRLLYNPDASRTFGSAPCAMSSGPRGDDLADRARQRQPHPADRHHGARAFGRQQYLLARDLPEPIARRCRASGPYTDSPRRACSATSARSIRSCSTA